MVMMIEQRVQLLQTLGSIATSAADAAAEGMAEAAKADSQIVDTALKLFGGFDRNEFENINGQAPKLLVPAVRPPASYEAPAEYFKPLSNTMADQNLLVPHKDLLQQLEDPRFRMADGLSGFSDNRITQTLAENGLSMGFDENGIIIVGGKPAEPGDMAASMDAFGKLYMMENTVEKQLQLHEQVDLGAFGYFSAAKQNPRLDRGLKDLPDAQAATQSKEMINLPLDHALHGTPATIGELLQMIDVLQAEMKEKMKELGPFAGGNLQLHAYINSVLQKLANLEVRYHDSNPNLPPPPGSVEHLRVITKSMQQYPLYIG